MARPASQAPTTAVPTGALTGALMVVPMVALMVVPMVALMVALMVVPMVALMVVPMVAPDNQAAKFELY